MKEQVFNKYEYEMQPAGAFFKEREDGSTVKQNQTLRHKLIRTNL